MQIKTVMHFYYYEICGSRDRIRLVFRYSVQAAGEGCTFHLKKSEERCSLESEVMSSRHHFDNFTHGRISENLVER